MCSPSAGTGSMRGPSSQVPGGSIAGSVPAGEPTSRQRSRAFSCGCSHTSCIVLTRALAICAASSRSTTCGAVSGANVSTMSSRSAVRSATRLALPVKRGSRASSGRSSTLSQKLTHSRSFCRPSITLPPSAPVGNGP